MAAARMGSSGAVPSLPAKGSRGGKVEDVLSSAGEGAGAWGPKAPGSPKLQGATGPASPYLKIRGNRVALQASNPPIARIANNPKTPAPNISIAMSLSFVE